MQCIVGCFEIARVSRADERREARRQPTASCARAAATAAAASDPAPLRVRQGLRLRLGATSRPCVLPKERVLRRGSGGSGGGDCRAVPPSALLARLDLLLEHHRRLGDPRRRGPDVEERALGRRGVRREHRREERGGAAPGPRGRTGGRCCCRVCRLRRRCCCRVCRRRRCCCRVCCRRRCCCRVCRRRRCCCRSLHCRRRRGLLLLERPGKEAAPGGGRGGRAEGGRGGGLANGVGGCGEGARREAVRRVREDDWRRSSMCRRWTVVLNTNWRAPPSRDP